MKRLTKKQYQAKAKRAEKRFAADIPWKDLPLVRNREQNFYTGAKADKLVDDVRKELARSTRRIRTIKRRQLEREGFPFASDADMKGI